MEQTGLWRGYIAALAAFATWSVAPIYIHQLRALSAGVVVAHRIIWSVVFCNALLIYKREWRAWLKLWLFPWRWVYLALSATMIGSNWLIFTWAVNHDQILDSSFGYYINPILNVFLGMLFLRERLRPLHMVAVFISVVSVGMLAFDRHGIPMISLSLAVTFSLYGLIRKLAPYRALDGLAIECTLFFIPALIYLHYSDAPLSTLQVLPPDTVGFLIGTGAMTALPLIWFNMGAKLLPLSALGFVQFISPTIQFLTAVFLYHETVTPLALTAFIMIWGAVILFIVDSVILSRKLEAMRQKTLAYADD